MAVVSLHDTLGVTAVVTIGERIDEAETAVGRDPINRAVTVPRAHEGVPRSGAVEVAIAGLHQTAGSIGAGAASEGKQSGERAVGGQAKDGADAAGAAE